MIRTMRMTRLISLFVGSGGGTGEISSRARALPVCGIGKYISRIQRKAGREHRLDVAFKNDHEAKREVNVDSPKGYTRNGGSSKVLT